MNTSFAILLLAISCAFVGCSDDAKRARHLSRAENYFQKGDYIKAELEYRNAARLSKTLDANLVTRLASIYHEQGRLPEAFSLLTNAVSLKPDDLEQRYRLGTAWLTFRNFKEAQQAALFVLEKRPNHPEALLLYVNTVGKPEEIAAARQKVNEIAKQSGDTWAVHLALAELAMREKQTNVMEKELELAAKLDPKASHVNVARAQLASLRSDLQQTEQFLRIAAENSPARSANRLLLAQFKMRGTNMTEAKALLDQQLKEAPDYVPAWTLRGRIAVEERDFPEVNRITRNVLSWAPTSQDIRLLRARALVLEKKNKEGIEEFERLETAMPSNPEPKYEMAVALVQDGNAEEALKKLEEAVRLNPNYAEAVILRAELKLRTGAADQAITELVQFIRNNPQVGQASLVLANAYRVSRRWDDALRIYRGFLQKNPRVPEFWLYEGMVLMAQKNYDQALLSFEQALNLAPTYVLAAEEMINIHLTRKDIDAAQLRVNEMLKATTNSAGALILQAKVCFAKKDWPCAESALSRVIQMQPDSMVPYSLLAEVYISQKEPKKALAQLRASVERNPKDTSAWMLMGVILEAENDLEAARKAYEEVIKVNPRNWMALNNLAYLLSEKLNRVDEALPHATKAREIRPNDGGIADTLGWIFYRRGENARALALLRESSEKLQDVAEVQYHLGMVHYAMGNEAAARSAFARVIELDKTFGEKKEVQQQLAVLDINPTAPNAVNALEAASRENEKDFFAALKLGQAYTATGANDKARTALERASKLNPNAAQPLILLASLSADKFNDVSKALELARAAQKLSPNDPFIAGVLGRISYRSGDHASAVALLQDYARSDRADSEVAYDLALAYYAVGNFGEARTQLGNYLKNAGGTRKSDANNLITLLDYYSGKGDARQAETIANSRLQRNQNDLPSLMTLGLLAERAGKYSDAAEKYERVASLDKSLLIAQRQLAIIYAERLQNDQKAQEFGTKARQAYPTDPELAIALGKVSYRRNDFPNAVRFLGEGVKQRNTDPEAFYYLGMAYHKLGKGPDAKTQLNQAISANLAPALASEAKKVLASLK